MSDIQLGLKVDVCTYAGLKDGVPGLMRLFDLLNIRASFFVACGPDHSGRAIRRLFHRGFFQKMMRTNAVGTYGWRTLLYGTLLPGPQIAASFPDTLRALVRAGHEVAMHGYDHAYWQNALHRLSATAVGAEIGRAAAVLTEILGCTPQAFGAPGWQCSVASFDSEDKAGLRYHSDARGREPFFPEIDGRRFQTVEIPTTLPTLDETYGRVGTTPSELTAYYRRQLRPGLNVYTAHAEMEGIRQLSHLRDFLTTLRAEAPCRRLIDIAAELQAVPVARVVPGSIPGRSGTVALQETTGA